MQALKIQTWLNALSRKGFTTMTDDDIMCDGDMKKCN